MMASEDFLNSFRSLTILLPKKNEPDLDDLPRNVRKELRFVLLENVEQALKEALVQE